jgi:hypothetical protein
MLPYNIGNKNSSKFTLLLKNAPGIRRASICRVNPAHAGCAASFITATYIKVGLVPQALCALPLAHFTKSSQNWQLASFYKSLILIPMSSWNPGTLD